MSFENNIKKMFAEFDEGQKDWFRFDLPNFLGEWISGGFNGKQLSKNPTLIEDYLKHEVSLSVVQKQGKLDDLLISLWCIRKCHGPIHAPTLYRLTKIPGLSKETQKVTLRAKNSLKPITSWTSTADVVVHDRNPSDSDYIIKIENIETKYVLGSMEIVDQFLDIVLRNAKHFDLDTKRVREISNRSPAGKKVKSKSSAHSLSNWKLTKSELRGFLDEKEYLIYLHPNEELRATVHKHVPDPYANKTSGKVVGKLAAHKKKLEAKKIKAKFSLVNPFLNSVGGMDKLSPAEQYKATYKYYDKINSAKPKNQALIKQISDTLGKMEEYAHYHDIDLEIV